MITRADLNKFRKKKLKELKKEGVEIDFSFLNLVEQFPNATYYVAFGERSGGKTYTALDYALEQWKFSGKTFCYVRRFDEAIRPKRASQVFAPFARNGYIDFLTEGEYNDTVFRVGKWFFVKKDENGEIVKKSSEPFCYAFALSQVENDKSASYPTTDNMVFDEFITREYYFPNELTLLTNVISTVFRNRAGCKVFMAGNTVNQFCPYFADMGLNHAPTMAPGTIDCYNYGDSRLQVVVTHTKPNEQGKPSDYYFAFDNPRLKMITESAWEIDIYPHLKGYKNKQIMFTFFIIFNGSVCKCDVVDMDGGAVINISPHTGPIKNIDTDLIYTTDVDPRPNFRQNILAPMYPVERKIYELFKMNKVFYATNQTGEIIRNYLIFCGKK